MTESVPDTSKGTIVLMRPPPDSVRCAAQAARPVWVVLPNYAAGDSLTFERYSPARSFMLIAEQSFNYDIHGSRGFDAVGRLIDQSQCYKLSYSRLDDAVSIFDDLLAGRMG